MKTRFGIHKVTIKIKADKKVRVSDDAERMSQFILEKKMFFFS